MKKLICALLVATMLLGSLAAFAGNCNHKNGAYSRDVDQQIDGCITAHYTNWYCNDCDAFIERTDYYTTGSHDWVVEIIDGREAKICYNCDKVVYL